jgi:hypothetical protein
MILGATTHTQDAAIGHPHTAWCEVADHDDFRPAASDMDGCTSAVRSVLLSRGVRAAGYVATPPLGGPARVVLIAAPVAGDRLTVSDAEALAAFLLDLVTVAVTDDAPAAVRAEHVLCKVAEDAGDDPAARYHAAVQAARGELDALRGEVIR